MKTYFLFFAWPYIAMTLLIVGVVVRYLLARRQMNAVSGEILEARIMFSGDKWWRISLLLLALGHGIALLLPRLVLGWNNNAARLYLLEISAFIVGVVALVSFARLLWRDLRLSQRSLLVEFSDMVFLALIFTGLMSGLLMAVLYRWGSSWGALTLTPYIASLFRLNPATQFAAQMPFLVRVHVFSAFAALAVLPLTRLAAVPVRMLHFILQAIAHPIETAGSAAEAQLRRPAAWLWPEED